MDFFSKLFFFLSFVLFGVFFTKTKTESVREELRYQKYSKRETRDMESEGAAADARARRDRVSSVGLSSEKS